MILLSRYETTFTDYEKMLTQGALNGFLRKNFQTIYEYLYKRVGVDFANNWMMQHKNMKKKYCAEIIIRYADSYNEAIVNKARNYVCKLTFQKRR